MPTREVIVRTTRDLLGDNGGAIFSTCELYRYSLWRVWNTKLPRVTWCMLNPSTADETVDDPTVRKCIGFARRWGYGGIYVVNLFAYRATDPRELANVDDPVGPLNDEWIAMETLRLRVVCAWGNLGAYQGRGRAVFELLRASGHTKSIMALSRTGTGQPGHPLYIPYATEPFVYTGQ